MRNFCHFAAWIPQNQRMAVKTRKNAQKRSEMAKNGQNSSKIGKK